MMMQLHVSRLNMSLVDQELSAIERIPAMQRRRLSRLAKLALNSAMQTLATQHADYIVWVSQYGDEAKTLNILADVLSEQTLHRLNFQPRCIMLFQVYILFYVRMRHLRPVWRVRGMMD